MYAIEKIATWDLFKARLKRYLGHDFEGRQAFLFRGHASSEWRLRPTIDRLSISASFAPGDRSEYLAKLITAFRDNSMGLQLHDQRPTTDEEWEFLGRHHGLPTSIMDWTRSPYVAAFFAFDEMAQAKDASIWVLQCSRIQLDQLPEVKLDQFKDTLRFNIRAAEQRGVSMRVLTNERSVEDVLGKALIRLDIPRVEREVALRELDEMLINHRTLYRDLIAAAKVAIMRMGAV